MSEEPDKLAELRKRLGLKTGAQWVKEREMAGSPPPGGVPEPVERPGGVPEAFSQQKDMLRRLTERLNLMQGSDWVRQQEELEQRRAAGEFEIDTVVPGQLVPDESGAFYLVRHDFPLDHHQGNVALGAVLRGSSKHIAFSACDPGLEDFDVRKTLFMDTETIGLAGGAGTVAFLVGAGYFTEEGFRLDQCFMRDYDDEEPMLRYVAGLLENAEAVVSYNGKSFDLPLLRTRFIQHRLPFRGDGLLHYDLVHVARRFWKRRLADCSLGNIEREVLGVRRHGDIPSFLIPQMWFDYLNTRDAGPLKPVFYHHRMDILSLVALTAWLCQCLERPVGESFEHTEDRLSLVRLHFKQKHYADVIQHANAFLEREDRSPLRRECLEMLAMACKRLQKFVEMQQAWELVLDEFPSDITARLELAKHHEHRTRDLPAAEKLLAEAVERYDPAPATLARLERIRRKLAKARRGMDLSNDADDDLEPA